jgi:ketosteroid isomerase-like protein
MTKHLNDFEAFMKQRHDVANAYVNGDAAPLGEITAKQSPATFFGPKGNYEQGAKHVFSVQEHDSKSFASGSTSEFEILHMSASDTIAYWVGLQHAKVHLQGKKDLVPFNLRVTEIFRRDNDEWKLIHRHADELKTPSDSEKEHKK